MELNSKIRKPFPRSVLIPKLFTSSFLILGDIFATGIFISGCISLISFNNKFSSTVIPSFDEVNSLTFSFSTIKTESCGLLLSFLEISNIFILIKSSENPVGVKNDIKSSSLITNDS